MSLVVFTGFVGLYLAPGDGNLILQTIAVLCIAIGAGASGAINMWYDRDIDAVMSRTRTRAIPSGKVTAEAALTFGVLLAGGSVMVMGLAVNWVAAILLMVTISFYVFVYTIWLKRRTPQNIVIGGAAGAFPPMIGWAAVTGTVSIESITLFTIIFMWTPPHFWALSLYRSDDYKAAGVPMMPLVHGRYETKKQILLYSIVLGPLGIAPFWLGTLGTVYGVASVLLGALFIGAAWRVMRNDSEKNCKQLFGFSIFYLFFLFFAMIVDRCTNFNPVL
ncbi:MAG: protoheme IX farnesyltransferase [Rhodospirillaceae bacterium]|nr:protoheme IX farnesyltransferase [Rhodospirillaceae bacterium]